MGKERRLVSDADRTVWLTDRYGDMFEGDEATLEVFDKLLETLDASEEEHRSISVTDSDGWNLAIYPNLITFANLDEDEPVGDLKGYSRDEALSIGRDFFSGDFYALRARDWQN